MQLEINPTPVTAAGDPGLAVYTGNTGDWNGNVTITVWQDYIDQVPMDQSGNPILPQDDIATLYQLNNTTLSALVANQDFGVPFANFRNFLSTVLVYDNAGVYNNGTDINYFALQTANSSNIWRYGPEEAALEPRFGLALNTSRKLRRLYSLVRCLAADKRGKGARYPFPPRAPTRWRISRRARYIGIQNECIRNNQQALA